MNAAPIQSKVSAADIPLDMIANNRSLTQPQKVAEVSRQFEALMLRQILQETQKTVIPSTFADTSTTSDIYHDMVINKIADSISKSGSLGLAKTLERQLGHQLSSTPPAKTGYAAATSPAAFTETETTQPNHLTTTEPFQNIATHHP
jgi:Rod binding domain-containing protein